MKAEQTLSDILRVEDSAQVLAVCCPDTGIPLWTGMRVPYLRMVLEDTLYDSPLNGGSRHSIGQRLQLMAQVGRSFAYNARHSWSPARAYPIILAATGARLMQRDGVYFNNLSDYFADAAPDRTLTIEDLNDVRWPFPRHNRQVLLHLPFRVLGNAKGRARASQYREPVRALVTLVRQRARDAMGWDMGDARAEWLARTGVNAAASFLPRFQTYQSLFRQSQARLLIKEEACYGGADNASMMVAARELGMVTAEYQHGSVAPGHIAYNFAPAVADSVAYMKTLPDYFLAYGEWWAEQINAPVRKVAIGNPHRTETLTHRTTAGPQRNKILILGDGVETHLYLQLCGQMASLLGGGFEVLFRPHPMERTRARGLYSGVVAEAVRLDAHPDIYDSFREAYAVVSEISTGMFEAIGLVPKVFIWDTPKARFTYPSHPFQRFSNADELVAGVLEDNAGRIDDVLSHRIWASHWRQNYLDFMEQATA